MIKNVKRQFKGRKNKIYSSPLRSSQYYGEYLQEYAIVDYLFNGIIQIKGADGMENELLQQILNKLDNLETKMDTLNKKVDTGFSDVNKRLDELPKEIASTLSNEVIPVISEQLHDIKTEVSIIKSSVGEHEMDIKYLKKVK